MHHSRKSGGRQAAAAAQETMTVWSRAGAKVMERITRTWDVFRRQNLLLMRRGVEGRVKDLTYVCDLSHSVDGGGGY